MNHEPKDAGERPASGGFTSTLTFRLLVAVAAVISLVMGVREVLEIAKPGLDRAAALAKVERIYAVQDDVDTHIASCDYTLFMICRPKAEMPLDELLASQPAASETSHTTQYAPVDLIVSAAVTLPRLPDAFLHVLGQRLRTGLLEFGMGLAYVLIYVAAIIVGFRSNPLAGCVAIVAGGWLAMGLFWLLRLLVSGLDALAGALLTLAITLTSIPSLALVCFPHHVMVAWESFIAVGRRTAPPPARLG